MIVQLAELVGVVFLQACENKFFIVGLLEESGEAAESVLLTVGVSERLYEEIVYNSGSVLGLPNKNAE